MISIKGTPTRLKQISSCSHPLVAVCHHRQEGNRPCAYCSKPAAPTEKPLGERKSEGRVLR